MMPTAPDTGVVPEPLCECPCGCGRMIVGHAAKLIDGWRQAARLAGRHGATAAHHLDRLTLERGAALARVKELEARLANPDLTLIDGYGRRTAQLNAMVAELGEATI